MLLATDSERVRTLLASLPTSRPRRVVRNTRDLPEALAAGDVRSVICDPNGVAESILQPLIEQVASCDAQMFIASTLTARMADLALRTTGRGLAGALVCNCEADRREMTRQLLAEYVGCALSLRLLARIRYNVQQLPRCARTALVGVASARCYAGVSIQAFAGLAGGSARSVERWLATAGLSRPRTVLAAFRLAHLWPELSASGLTLSAVAHSGGFGSDRTLRAHCGKMLQWSPSHIRQFRSADELLHGLERAVRERARGEAPDTTDGNLHLARAVGA